MAAQALYLKWRPMTFEEVVGQERVTYTLRNALAGERIAHAYLFTGPRGTGKTTLARILAKAVNCLAEDAAQRPCNECEHCRAVNEGRFLDLIEIDAASHTSVDDVRELRDRISFAPNEGRYKVYIVDEVHRFSGAAFDALLKTIEEPPAHALFVLATTEIHKVPQTILSRCQRFDFRRISIREIVDRLTLLAQAEGLQAEEAALELIARQATGSLRDAISLFDQLVARPDEVLTLDLAQAILGTAASQAVQELTGLLIGGDAARGLMLISEVLDAGADPRQLARQMVEYLRLVMLVQTGGAQLGETLASAEGLAIAQEQAGAFPRRALLESLNAFNDAASDRVGGWQPQLPLEIAFLKSLDTVRPQPADQTNTVQPIQQAAPSAQVTQSVVESAPQQPAASGMPSLADIQLRWPEVLAALRQRDRALEALLKNSGGRLYRIEGNTIVFLMPSEILIEKVEKQDARSTIEDTLTRILGIPVQFKGVVGSAASGEQSTEMDNLLAQDSLAAFAVNELGASVKTRKKRSDA